MYDFLFEFIENSKNAGAPFLDNASTLKPTTIAFLLIMALSEKVSKGEILEPDTY